MGSAGPIHDYTVPLLTPEMLDKLHRFLEERHAQTARRKFFPQDDDPNGRY